MISLSFSVENIATVIQVYDRIRVQRADAEEGPFSNLTTMTPSEIELLAGTSSYSAIDTTGTATNWYRSQYYLTTNSGIVSGWSDPVLGEAGDIFYDPLYPPEVSYGTSDQLIIDRIRRLTGDPLGIRREYGEDALSSVHPDGKTYELDEKGWPASVHMGGEAMNNSADPVVNGYKYLVFSDYIGDVCYECVTYSGVCGEDVVKEVAYGPDIWYYTFRNSDRQLMEAYDSCPPPPPLTTSTATSEAYMLQTSIDILRQELWHDATEDGAVIKDEGSNYNPDPGLKVRKQLLDDLQNKLDKLVKYLMLSGVTGVLVD